MVWFQCEECGENLKKPKLPTHFRICSASKLSCIDCGDIFSRETVQTHTQCMTEAEKYGPKDHGKPSQNSNSKPEKPKKNADVDINVGLSLRPPWFCSLCNTPATSKQTLLLHADGKKHRAKAKAFLTAQKQSNQTEESRDNDKENAVISPKLEPVVVDKKRKHDLNNGEVIQAQEKEENSPSKRSKNVEKLPNYEGIAFQVSDVVSLKKNIKWKKLIISILKSKPDGTMKIKKVEKLVMKELKVLGINGDEAKLRDAMMEKINSSSRFVIIDSKFICLASKSNKS